MKGRKWYVKLMWIVLLIFLLLLSLICFGAKVYSAAVPFLFLFLLALYGFLKPLIPQSSKKTDKAKKECERARRENQVQASQDFKEPIDKLKEIFKPTISVSVSTHYEDVKFSPFEVPCLDLGKNPSGGYMSCAKYKVKGTKQSTGRLNTRYIEAHSEDAAISKMSEMGFTDPFIEEILPFDPATQKQLDYAHDMGAIFPDDVSRADASAILSRMLDDDDRFGVKDVKDKANLGFAKYARDNDVQFSAFDYPLAILAATAYQLPDVEKLTLYICAIDQDKKGRSIIDCDPRTLPIYSQAKGAAPDLLKDEYIAKSTKELDIGCYLNPHGLEKFCSTIKLKLS